MPPTPMIRVRAVGDVLVPRVGADGVPEASAQKSRFHARDAQKRALPDGELVPDTSYHRAEIEAGTLDLVAAAPPAPRPETAFVHDPLEHTPAADVLGEVTVLATENGAAQ